MAEPTLYLFDGHNLLHAGSFDGQRELTDVLASFVAMRGARGVLVWDGVGVDAEIGPLSVRFAAHADAVLERLAAEHRDTEEVCLVSSDFAVQRHVRPGGAEAIVRSVPRRPRASAPRGAARLPPAATRSTTRRASGSSGCAAARGADTNIRS